MESTDGGEEDEEYVEKLRALGGFVDVVVVEVDEDFVPGSAGLARLGLGWGWLHDGSGLDGCKRRRSNNGRCVGGFSCVLLGSHRIGRFDVEVVGLAPFGEVMLRGWTERVFGVVWDTKLQGIWQARYSYAAPRGYVRGTRHVPPVLGQWGFQHQHPRDTSQISEKV